MPRSPLHTGVGYSCIGPSPKNKPARFILLNGGESKGAIIGSFYDMFLNAYLLCRNLNL